MRSRKRGRSTRSRLLLRSVRLDLRMLALHPWRHYTFAVTAEGRLGMLLLSSSLPSWIPHLAQELQSPDLLLELISRGPLGSKILQRASQFFRQLCNLIVPLLLKVLPALQPPN